MERRAFIERVFLCVDFRKHPPVRRLRKDGESLRFGNEEKLWELAAGRRNWRNPLSLAYSKNTPALYRDASMGKADPSFIPKVSGG